MPRSSTIQAQVCTSLDKLSKDYGPRRKVYPDPCPSDIHRKGVYSHGGVEALGSPSFEAGEAPLRAGSRGQPPGGPHLRPGPRNPGQGGLPRPGGGGPRRHQDVAALGDLPRHRGGGGGMGMKPLTGEAPRDRRWVMYQQMAAAALPRARRMHQCNPTRPAGRI